MPQLNTGVPDRYHIDHQCSVDQQPSQRNANTNLASRNQSRLAAGAHQLRTVEVQLRTTKAPACVHPSELDLHTDRGAGPAFYFFLVLGQAWQKQAKQADRNREHYHDARGRVGGDLNQALKDISHRLTSTQRQTDLADRALRFATEWTYRFAPQGQPGL